MQVLSTSHFADAALKVAADQHQARSAGPAESATPGPPQLAVSPSDDAGLPETTGSASALKYDRSERTTLYIQTQEGDVVRLKFRARESANLQVVEQQDDDAEVSELTLETRSASRLSVQVRGNLNAQEFAVIQDTVRQAIELADDFFAGDVQAAFESAAALDIDGEQLARVQLKMRVRERLTYSAQGFGSMHAIGRETPEDTEASADVPPVSPDATAVASESVGTAPEPAEPASEEPAGPPEVAADPYGRSQAMKAIIDFLGQVLDAVGANDAGPHADSLEVSLKIRIVQSTFLTLSEIGPEEESPIPGLLPETLDALATQEEAQLDQVA